MTSDVKTQAKAKMRPGLAASAMLNGLSREGSRFSRIAVIAIVSNILRLFILSVIAALFAMLAAPYLADTPAAIAGALAALCVPGEVCDFATVYAGLGLALFLTIGTTALLVMALVDITELRDADPDTDENMPDIVLEELDWAASRNRWLTGADLARLTGLDRTDVQVCLGCLLEDGAIQMERGGTPDTPDSLMRYRSIGKKADE